MKQSFLVRISLLALAAGWTGAVLADPSHYIEQVGDDNSIALSQIEGFADIRQHGDNLKANVTQGGFDHTAKIMQSGGTADYGGTARVNQSGAVKDEAIINQGRGTSVNVVQSGAAHNIATVNLFTVESGIADITQIGTGGINTATLNSSSVWGGGGISQKGANLTASINQSGTVFGNGASIEQTGSDHKASIGQGQGDFSQGFGGNGATVKQNGSGNVADVSQSSHDGVLTATVMQDGSNHKATIWQNPVYSDADVIVEQSGDGHVAEVTQNGSDATGAMTAVIRGKGANTAVVEQSDWQFMFAHSTIIQEGAGNFARTGQQNTEGHHSSTIEQHGNNHTADVQHAGISNNDSVIIARGSGSATVFQRSVFGSSGSTIEQSGENQQANVLQDVFTYGASSMITQSGADNVASVRQEGFDTGLSTSEIVMEGSGNNATVTQVGRNLGFDPTNNTSQITVQGNGNMVTVQQGQ